MCVFDYAKLVSMEVDPCTGMSAYMHTYMYAYIHVYLTVRIRRNSVTPKYTHTCRPLSSCARNRAN